MNTLNMRSIRSLAGRSYRLAMLPRDWLIRRTLAHVDAPEGSRFAHVLDRLHARDPGDLATISAIERERERLLACTDPLADGSRGQAGPYDAGLSVSDACRASKPPKPSLLMYLLVREFQPSQLIELGTNLGISSAYQAAALAANRKGHITTLEASPYRIGVAQDVHRRLGLENVTYVQGLFGDTLDATLQKLPPIDFAFIDGHHQYQPTLDYTNSILARAAPAAVLVYDDIRWSDGMKRAWRELKSDPRFQFVLDLFGIGICVRVPSTTMRRYSFPPIFHSLY